MCLKEGGYFVNNYKYDYSYLLQQKTHIPYRRKSEEILLGVRRML